MHPLSSDETRASPLQKGDDLHAFVADLNRSVMAWSVSRVLIRVWLREEEVAARGSCGARKLQREEAAARGSCSVRKLQREEDIFGYQSDN